MTKFDYFCPMINQECLGDKCAGFVTEKRRWYEYDTNQITTIEATKPKDKDIKYQIVVMNLTKEVEDFTYRCHHYIPLTKTEKKETPLNKLAIYHSKKHKWVFESVPPNYQPAPNAKTEAITIEI